MKKRRAIYPGTFDPLTYGHMDIIKRAVPLVDHLVIGLARDTNKNPLFPLEQRVSFIQALVPALEEAYPMTLEVQVFQGLLVDFARKKEAQVIIRGLRAVSDFEYEFQMTGMNAHLAPEIETIFLMASEKHQFISSRFVKEVARLGGDVKALVPEVVYDALQKHS